MRLFIALELPDYLKERLGSLIEDFKRADLRAKWIKRENLHITLKFLGEVKEEKTEEIINIIQRIAPQFKPLEVKLKEFGFFPNQKKPRVFFIATDQEEILKKLSQKLEEELEKIGFPKENRFRSHITLARFKEIRNNEALKKKLESIILDDKFIIENITLFKSTLTPKGAVYQRIFTANL